MEKQCRTCECFKPEDQFTKHKAVCKECRSSQNSQLKKMQREVNSQPKKLTEPGMIFLHKKIIALNDLFAKTTPNLDILKEYIVDIVEVYQQLESQQICFYVPIEISEHTKKYLRPALNFGLTVDAFRNSILLRNEEIIVDDLGLDMAGSVKCIDEVTAIYDMINTIRMGYFCISKYAKHDMRKNGNEQKTEELFVNIIYDVDSQMVIMKQNPMHLTIEQFVIEVRKIIAAHNEILVSQFEQMGLYNILLETGLNNITKPAT